MLVNQYKLLVSDLDGTLVPSGTDLLSLRTKATILGLKKTQLQFTVATGRSFMQAKKIITDLQIKLPVILQTGALIMDPQTEKILYCQPLRATIAQQVEGMAKDAQVETLCLVEDGLYYSEDLRPATESWLLRSGEQGVCSNKDAEAEVLKYLLLGSEQQLQQLRQTIIRQLCPRPNLILWPPDSGSERWILEVFDPLASKGQALVWLTQQLQMQLAEVIACGDGHNDLDMLGLTGLGIAMAQASPEIHSAAKMSVAGPEHDGIADFLTRYFFDTFEKSS